MNKLYLLSLVFIVSLCLNANAQQPCDVYFSKSVSGGTATFNAYHSDTSAIGSYSWTFGDGGTSTVQNPTYTYASPGTYTVVVNFVSSTDTSCTPSYSDTISINIASNYNLAGLIYAGGSILDEGYVTIYKKDSILFYSYMDTLIFGGEFNISFPQGDYLVKVSPTSSSAFFGQYLPTYYGDSTLWTGAQQINLNSNMSLSFYLVPFNVTDTTWNTGNDIISGTVLQDTTGFGRSATNPVRNTTVNMRNNSNDLLIAALTDENGVFEIKNIAAGDYKLIVDYPGYTMQPFSINADGDSTTSTSVNFDLNQNGSIATSALYNQNKIKIGSVSVYPNPASQIVTISSPSFNLSPIQVKITSFSGKVVYNEQAVLNNEEVKLDTSQWPSGIYFITVQTEEVISTKKLVIKH